MSATNSLEKALNDAVKKEAEKLSYEVECPKCKEKIRLVPGLTSCPLCGTEIDFKLDLNL